MVLSNRECFTFTESSTESGDCQTGEVRFAADYSDNSTETSRQGTIQICVNNAWGTVCSDNLFDTTDAGIFCDQLEGFTSDGNILEISSL